MVPREELSGLLSGLANLDDDGLSMLSALAKAPKAASVGQDKTRICIIERLDPDDYLPSLAVCLQNYHPSFEVFAADNSDDALDILANGQGIKLVIVDLRLPGIEGFKLLGKLFRDYPTMPVVVMSAGGNAVWRENVVKFCDLGVLRHPLDLNDLQNAVNKGLNNKTGSGKKTNILGGLVALLEMEQKTTLMALSCGSKSGSCFVRAGQIVDAICGDKSGEEALRELLGWEKPEILFAEFNDQKIKRKIKKSIVEIAAGLSSSLDCETEKESATVARGKELTGKGSNKLIESKNVSDIPWDNDKESAVRVASHEVGFSVDPKNLKEESGMALESYLERFKKINGYKASAIMNFTGEILAQDSSDPNIDLGLVGATFNDIFRTAHEASDKIGLEACREAAISTPKGIIIMRCSGIKAKVHYHTIAIFSADGNQALAKMEMEKMIPLVMDELA